MDKPIFPQMANTDDSAVNNTTGSACCVRYRTFFLILLLFVATACSTVRPRADLPPLLAQEELQRPYTKLAVVQVHRQRYGSSYEPQPDDYTWAHEALREEAAKIGADAVIFPEVKIEGSSYLLFPSTEVDARGVAIKFQ